MTALAATVGTGNIAGVATAIAAGGPGALFWMWMTGLVGMATKFAEAVLAVKYREVDDRGQMAGGPMYYIERGLGLKWLGVVFALLTSVAAFGIGNLFGSSRFVGVYRVVWVMAAFVGAVTSLELVWAIADVFNGAMAVPNLIALVGLSGVVVAETRDYFNTRGS